MLQAKDDGTLEGASHTEDSANQIFSLQKPFIVPHYQMAFLPGFPGPADGECWKSQSDQDLSKLGMRYCDTSMNLLLGKTTSVGTLRAIVKDIKDNGNHRMPGVCCLDNAINSQYFGYNVSLYEEEDGLIFV